MNHPASLNFGESLLYGLKKGKLQQTLRSGPRPRVVVSTNPILMTPISKLMRREYPEIPFVGVVTDLVSVHRAWVVPNTPLILSPTSMASESLIRLGQPPSTIRETGLPISSKFQPVDPVKKCDLRIKSGLAANKTTILIMHGAEGHHRVFEIVSAIESKFGETVQQIVICGKNDGLRKKLEAKGFGPHIKIFGFTNKVGELMQVSDVLITKAGSLTVSEALACGLPPIISEYLPGQEGGTPEWLVGQGAGWAAYKTEFILAELSRLTDDPGLLQKRASNARELGKPHAATNAAYAILDLISGKNEKSPAKEIFAGMTAEYYED
jgi:UDP-N-acetylglucosamine:LPS N-acetylglucosamine transferase